MDVTGGRWSVNPKKHGTKSRSSRANAATTSMEEAALPKEASADKKKKKRRLGKKISILRKAALMSKLLNRHKRIDRDHGSSGVKENVGSPNTTSDSSSSRKKSKTKAVSPSLNSHSSRSTSKSKAKKPLQNMLEKSLRHKKKKSHGSMNSIENGDASIADCTSQTSVSDCRLVLPLKSDKEEEATVTTRSESEFSVEVSNKALVVEQQYRGMKHPSAQGRTHWKVTACSIVTVLSCLVSLVFVQSAIAMVACLMTIGIARVITRLDSKTSVRQDLEDSIQVLKQERDVLQSSNTRLRSRSMAKRAELQRQSKVQAVYERECVRSGDVNRIVRLQKLQEATRHDVEQRQRQETLVLVTKVLLVSNRDKSTTVLNSLGIELLSARLKKMQGVTFYPHRLRNLVQRVGPEQAVKALLKSVLGQEHNNKAEPLFTLDDSSSNSFQTSTASFQSTQKV